MRSFSCVYVSDAEVLAKLIVVFTLRVKISLYYAQYFTVFELLSGSLELDYKVNSTGTGDKGVLLKFVSVVHMFTIIKKITKKKVI